MSGLRGIITSLFENILSGFLLDFVSIVLTMTVLVLAGIIIVKVVNRLLRSVFNIRKNDKQTVTVGKLIQSVSRLVIWFIVIVTILAEVGIDVTAIIASAGVVAFAFGFGAQEMVKDFIAGFFLVIENTVYVGDVVEVDGFKGEVISLGLRTTSLKNWLGQIKTINNGSINTIINFSKENSLAIVDFAVDYSTDLKQLSSIMPSFLESIKAGSKSVVEVPQFLGVTELGKTSINLRIIAKTKSNEQYAVERTIRKELVEILNKNNVVIPFPQMIIRNAK
jgi:small conductance mechanosensitive channel